MDIRQDIQVDGPGIYHCNGTRYIVRWSGSTHASSCNGIHMYRSRNVDNIICLTHCIQQAGTCNRHKHGTEIYTGEQCDDLNELCALIRKRVSVPMSCTVLFNTVVQGSGIKQLTASSTRREAYKAIENLRTHQDMILSPFDTSTRQSIIHNLEVECQK